MMSTSSSRLKIVAVVLASEPQPLNKRHSKKDKKRVEEQMMESHVCLKVECSNDEHINPAIPTLILSFCNCSGYRQNEIVKIAGKVKKRLKRKIQHYTIRRADLPTLANTITKEITGMSTRSLELSDCCRYEKIKQQALRQAFLELRRHSDHVEDAHSGLVYSYNKLTDTYLDDNFININEP